MTMNITVTIPEDDIKAGAGAQYLARAMDTIGFSRASALGFESKPEGSAVPPVCAKTGEEINKGDYVNASISPDGSATMEKAEAPKAAPPAEVNPRAFGESEEGKARRNKDQMAEDKEIEELWPRDKNFIPTDIPATQLLADLKAGKISAETPNISTGGERVDPASVEDKAQDAADEAAEVAANKSDALTLDDLRKAAGDFQKRFDMATAMEVIPELLGCGLHEVPEDQIADAIKKLEAYEGNGADTKQEETPFVATKADVIAEMLNYAEKYDGEREDQSKMLNLTADRGKIFEAALGEGVDGLSKVPDEGEAYGKAVLAFREAIAKNPFNREVKG